MTVVPALVIVAKDIAQIGGVYSWFRLSFASLSDKMLKRTANCYTMSI